MKLKFESSISFEYYNNLNDLLFFNENQKIYKGSIVNAIETYGIPKIIKVANKVTIQLKESTETHNLFLLDDSTNKVELLGVAIFIRETATTSTLLHIAMNESSSDLTLLLIMKVKEYLKNIKGMQELNIFYSNRVSTLRII